MTHSTDDLARWLATHPGMPLHITGPDEKQVWIDEAWPDHDRGVYYVTLSDYDKDKPVPFAPLSLEQFAHRLIVLASDRDYAHSVADGRGEVDSLRWRALAAECDEMYEQMLPLYASRALGIPVVLDNSGRAMRLSDNDPVRERAILHAEDTVAAALLPS
jgi:hypothetical protein